MHALSFSCLSHLTLLTTSVTEADMSRFLCPLPLSHTLSSPTLPEANLHGKYACVCIAVACVYATYPPTHAWAANNFGNETKLSIGRGLYTALGNLGSIAGTFFFYPTTETPQFKKGHFICMGLSIVTAVLAPTNHLILVAIPNGAIISMVSQCRGIR